MLDRKFPSTGLSFTSLSGCFALDSLNLEGESSDPFCSRHSGKAEVRTANITWSNYSVLDNRDPESISLLCGHLFTYRNKHLFGDYFATALWQLTFC